jgi:hypothetical protein
MFIRNAIVSAFLLLLLLPMRSPGYFDMNRSETALGVMNDIDFKKFSDFTEKWHLVTVRLREDTKEIRLTYANPLAWEHLSQAKQGPFPEGSMFGKVAFNLETDPAFASSLIPSKNRRYQLMVKDRKKYSTTGDWGYALFDADGRIFNEDVKLKTAACFACHQIVQPRDYVFSIPMPLSVGMHQSVSKAGLLSIQWTTDTVTSLTPELKKEIGPSFKTLDSVSSPLTKAYFSGTLDEIVPTLLERSRKTGIPALFYGAPDAYSAVIPLGKKCHVVKVRFQGKIVRNEQVCR